MANNGMSGNAQNVSVPNDTYKLLKGFALKNKVKVCVVLRAMIPLSLTSMGKDISKEIWNTDGKARWNRLQKKIDAFKEQQNAISVR
jgi:hypothetical protein